jgi:hypothetical protein
MICLRFGLANPHADHRYFVIFICGLILSLVIGCGRSGPEVVPVKGTITYGGGAWPKAGTLQFVADPAEPNQTIHPAAGHFDTDGRLTVSTLREGDGLVPGRYAIGVSCHERPPSKTELEFPPNYVPARFRNPATSGLKVAVTSGQKVVEVNFSVPKQ